MGRAWNTRRSLVAVQRPSMVVSINRRRCRWVSPSQNGPILSGRRRSCPAESSAAEPLVVSIKAARSEGIRLRAIRSASVLLMTMMFKVLKWTKIYYREQALIAKRNTTKCATLAVHRKFNVKCKSIQVFSVMEFKNSFFFVQAFYKNKQEQFERLI